MKITFRNVRGYVALGILLVTILAAPDSVRAHCDTLDGPVVKTARIALEQGDVTPLLKWVRADEEQNIQAAFQNTLTVRAMGPAAKDFADNYFFETLVRIHRAGEGAPYSGLKPGVAVDPAVALADRALETGSVDKLVTVLTKALEVGIRERYAHAHENLQHASDSIGAGREFVESYVVFTHYVEGLHGLIKGESGHHDESVAMSDTKHGH
jgi:Family of unknown function (DUF6448)